MDDFSLLFGQFKNWLKPKPENQQLNKVYDVATQGAFMQLPNELKLVVLRHIGSLRSILNFAQTNSGIRDFVASVGYTVMDPLFQREIKIVSEQKQWNLLTKYNRYKQIEKTVTRHLCFESLILESELETDLRFKLNDQVRTDSLALRLKENICAAFGLEEDGDRITDGEYLRYKGLAANGDNRSQLMLGFYLICGDSLPKTVRCDEKKEIVERIEVLAQFNENLSANWLYGLWLMHRENALPEDKSKGEAHLSIAAQGGYALAIKQMANMRWQDCERLSNDDISDMCKSEEGQQKYSQLLDDLVHWLVQAINCGSSIHKMMLGTLILDGKIVRKTLVEQKNIIQQGVQLLEDASNEGSHAASCRLAQYHCDYASLLQRYNEDALEKEHIFKARDLLILALDQIGGKTSEFLVVQRMLEESVLPYIKRRGFVS